MTHRLNNLDDLIINQGFMSERTNTPRRMNQQQFFQNQVMIHNNMGQNNANKLNSGRDMSPNKIVAKNKPLMNNNNINQPQPQYGGVYNNMPQGNHMNNNSRINLGQFNNQQQNSKIGNYSTLQHNKNNQNNLLYPPQHNNQYPNSNINGNWRNIKSPRSPNEQQMGNMNQNNWTCSNHMNKRAEFMTETDGQVIYYCQTCAAKLAAQQFQVIKLPVGNFAIGSNGMVDTGYGQHQQHFNNNNNTTTVMNRYKHNTMNNNKTSTLHRRRRQIPNLPQYKNNPVYQSIIQFLKQIYTVQQYHYQTHQQLSQIDQHYTQQITMVDEFYNQLIQILQKMHQDHLADMQTEFKKHSQMKDIYLNEIHENLETIEQIVNDLDENFETVVNKITNQDIQFFNQALDKNRSNIRFFSNQIEQQKDMLTEVVHYKEERLMQMIQQFENSLIELWADPKQHDNKKINNINVINKNANFNTNAYNKPQGQNLPRSNNHQQNQINLNNILQPNNRQQNIKNQQQHKINILQIHQNQPKSALTRDFEGKGACRQIFEDDQEENITQQVSPKFKNI